MIAMTYLLDDSEVIFISNLNPSQKKDDLQWKCIVSECLILAPEICCDWPLFVIIAWVCEQYNGVVHPPISAFDFLAVQCV